MKNSRKIGSSPARAGLMFLAAAFALAVWSSAPARASTAYGDLNNFDVFNDTGEPCHGFEIELEDIHSTAVTYTYDWNHYGAPTITEDNSDPAHPKVLVRYAAKVQGGAFTAFTAVPASAPAATNGHMCTNPSVNFGCEHFGVGYYGTPTLVKYHWLIEDPLAPGSLKRGPMVNVATPSWVYYPPAGGLPAQVQAEILAPPPPPVPVYEFGDAVWVKSIVTTSHSNEKVELKDLVSDDPDDDADKNWTNGEPDEVEIEWQILQTEFSNPDGANNDLAGALEDLPGGDEVVTRRYEFYKYAGPFDPESYEADCSKYPQISDPLDPSYKAECDPADVTVLGDYIGAQMAGFNVEAVLGLIDHIEDGNLNEAYTDRTVVVGGNTPYVTTVSAGALPTNVTIDSATGVLSGTPSAAGVFTFTLTATDADLAEVSKAYTIRVAGGGADLCDGVLCIASDACHEAGICDPATGACSNPAAADGTVCDDVDACTATDICQAGLCIGADPVVCTASEDCHVAGICDPATGLCSDPIAPDGAACDEGDGCPADSCIAGVCQAVSCADVDVALLPVRHLHVNIAAGATEVLKTLSIKVRNADTVERSISLDLEDSNCPVDIAGDPDFDSSTPAAQSEALVGAGKVRTAKLALTIRSGDFTSVRPKAPARCTLVVRTAALVAGGSNDPNPANNVALVEINVVDDNDAATAALHETVVKSANSMTLSIRAGETNATKTLRAAVVNADAEPAGSAGDAITLNATSSCAGVTLGTPVCDRATSGNSVMVAGGASKNCKIEVTADAGQITTANKLSPTRCQVTLTAIGPSDPQAAPLDPSNNSTEVTIDVIDKNDVVN